jgi:PAS domain S-box-containing protein
MTTLIIITATGFVVLIATLVWAAHRLTQPAPQQSAADPGMESALLDALPDAVVFVNDSGVILRANRAAANMFAMPALEGTRVEDLVPEHLRDRHREHVREYFADPRERPMGLGLPLFGVRLGGTQFPVEIALKPLPGRRQAVAVIRDMTARHAASSGVRTH